MKASVQEQSGTDQTASGGRKRARMLMKVDVAISEFQFTLMELLSRPGVVSMQLSDISSQTHLPLPNLLSIVVPMVSRVVVLRSLRT